MLYKCDRNLRSKFLSSHFIVFQSCYQGSVISAVEYAYFDYLFTLVVFGELCKRRYKEQRWFLRNPEMDG